MKSNNKVSTFAKNFHLLLIAHKDLKNIFIYYMKTIINNRLINKRNLKKIQSEL